MKVGLVGVYKTYHKTFGQDEYFTKKLIYHSLKKEKLKWFKESIFSVCVREGVGDRAPSMFFVTYLMGFDNPNGRSHVYKSTLALAN